MLSPIHLGLALYRALLRQCRAPTVTAPWFHDCKPLVQQNFRKYRKLQSPSQTANALKAGYEVCKLYHRPVRAYILTFHYPMAGFRSPLLGPD